MATFKTKGFDAWRVDDVSSQINAFIISESNAHPATFKVISLNFATSDDRPNGIHHSVILLYSY